MLVEDRTRSKERMLMLTFNKTADKLATANTLHWYGNVLRREDGDVLRRVIEFKAEGQKVKQRVKMTRKRPVEG